MSWPRIDWLRDVPLRSVATERRTPVWVAREIIADFGRDALSWVPRESGGALLGYRADEGVALLDFVPGGPLARRRCNSFLPDDRFQQQQIRQRYHASGGLLRYLGEVHSHPAGGLELSRRDRRTARRIAHHSAARLPRPVMLLFASDDGQWRASAWEFVDEALQPCRLYVLSRADLLGGDDAASPPARMEDDAREGA